MAARPNGGGPGASGRGGGGGGVGGGGGMSTAVAAGIGVAVGAAAVGALWLATSATAGPSAPPDTPQKLTRSLPADTAGPPPTATAASGGGEQASPAATVNTSNGGGGDGGTGGGGSCLSCGGAALQAQLRDWWNAEPSAEDIAARRRRVRVLRGAFVHSGGLSALHVCDDHVLGVDDSGMIVFFEPSAHLHRLASRFGLDLESDVTALPHGSFVCPGLVDAHVHAPQFTFAGSGMDLHLMKWLETYTFPAESKFKDPEVARKVYPKVVKRLLRNGTTTASYFGTIHLEASMILAENCRDLGQRAFVGKVCMDQNAPDFYIETTEESLEQTVAFVAAVQSLDCSRVKPTLTPRFVPTCSTELMNGLGSLAREQDLHVQTHVSESPGEIEFVHELHPNVDSYTAVYDEAGLVGPKTVLAHAVHLSEEEQHLIRKRKAGVAHCPSSNTSLLSGLFDARVAHKHGVTVGLGTDVAGGYSSSILDATRQAIAVSKAIAIRKGARSELNCGEAFYMATLGGAEALGIADVVGNFECGKQFDALVVDTHVHGGAYDDFEDVTATSTVEIFERFLYLGDDRNIVEVFVDGKTVKPPPE